eukprot:TRINITY_DN11245_c0_g1_i3.p1 TRINITY_DN11245_c0_g1~~TRINITY_DN11245_c0_g1_i3.p1  ORF type:complete len:1402 (+),score=136.92 TRINITY_DN11245_c0_g1_i3:73-4206(+)
MVPSMSALCLLALMLSTGIACSVGVRAGQKCNWPSNQPSCDLQYINLSHCETYIIGSGSSMVVHRMVPPKSGLVIERGASFKVNERLRLSGSLITAESATVDVQSLEVLDSLAIGDMSVITAHSITVSSSLSLAQAATLTVKYLEVQFGMLSLGVSANITVDTNTTVGNSVGDQVAHALILENRARFTTSSSVQINVGQLTLAEDSRLECSQPKCIIDVLGTDVHVRGTILGGTCRLRSRGTLKLAESATIDVSDRKFGMAGAILMRSCGFLSVNGSAKANGKGKGAGGRILISGHLVVGSGRLEASGGCDRDSEGRPGHIEVRYRHLGDHTPTASTNGQCKSAAHGTVTVDLWRSDILEGHFSSTVPASGYVGVELDVSEFAFALDGWHMHYEEPYSHATTLSDLSSIPQIASLVFVGARASDGHIALGAWGKREHVLHQTADNITHLADNVWWYLKDGLSFGFSARKTVELRDIELPTVTKILRHNGWDYATMDNADPHSGVGEDSRQGGALRIPQGWEIVPNISSVDKIAVIQAGSSGGYSWSTYCLVLGDGTSWYTDSGKACGNQGLVRKGGSYYTIWARPILMWRQPLAVADISNEMGEYRLSWPLDGVTGGYRAATTVGLQHNLNWRKLVYYRVRQNDSVKCPSAAPGSMDSSVTVSDGSDLRHAVISSICGNASSRFQVQTDQLHQLQTTLSDANRQLAEQAKQVTDVMVQLADCQSTARDVSSELQSCTQKQHKSTHGLSDLPAQISNLKTQLSDCEMRTAQVAEVAGPSQRDFELATRLDYESLKLLSSPTYTKISEQMGAVPQHCTNVEQDLNACNVSIFRLTERVVSLNVDLEVCKMQRQVVPSCRSGFSNLLSAGDSAASLLWVLYCSCLTTGICVLYIICTLGSKKTSEFVSTRPAPASMNTATPASACIVLDTWPVVHEAPISDDDNKACGMRILILCPGADSVHIDSLHNGVRVCLHGISNIENPSDQLALWTHDFFYDFSTHGTLELRQDEVSLEDGICSVVLRCVSSVPPRMSLSSKRVPPVHVNLATLPEEPTPFGMAQLPAAVGGGGSPDIHFLSAGAHSEDSRSAVSSSWAVEGVHESAVESEPEHTVAGSRSNGPSANASVGSWAVVSSVGSSSSNISWVSAPGRLNVARCFLPTTRFKRPNGAEVIAAELSQSGDVLLGPDGCEVKVHKKVRIPKSERDFVQLRLDGANCFFAITTNHPVLVEGPDGTQEVVEAGSILGANGTRKRVFSGVDYHSVVEANAFTDVTEVIELTFADSSATVIAWTPPQRRRPRRGQGRLLQPENGVAVRGAQLSQQHCLAVNGFVRRHGFVDEMSPASPHRRSRSVGSKALPESCFSVGSRDHPAKYSANKRWGIM